MLWAMKAMTALALVPLLCGCAMIHRSMDTEQGSGTRKTETRSVGNFTEVEANGGAKIKLQVGPKPSLQITADDNLLDNYTTEVKGSRLVIATRGNMEQRKSAEITITVPSLDSLTLTGAVQLDAQGLSTDELNLRLTGASQVRLKGEAAKVRIESDGAAVIRAEDLSVKDAAVALRGASLAFLNVRSNLTGSADGASQIQVTGSPRLNVNTSGAARVTKS